MSTAHHLTIIDRDQRDNCHHAHRFGAVCLCGWSAVPRRQRRDVVEEYREHVLARHRRRSRYPPHPRPLTPADRLPPQLRHTG